MCCAAAVPRGAAAAPARLLVALGLLYFCRMALMCVSAMLRSGGGAGAGSAADRREQREPRPAAGSCRGKVYSDEQASFFKLKLLKRHFETFLLHNVISHYSVCQLLKG